MCASIKTYGDTIHTFVDRSKYTGVFMPGYGKPVATEPLSFITYVLLLRIHNTIICA